MKKDLYDTLAENTAVKPKLVSNTASGNGTGVDLLGYEGCLMVAEYGAVGDKHDTSNYVTVSFLASTNNTVFSAIADTDLIGGNNTELIDANAEGNSTHRRCYVGDKRYVTVSFVVTGTMANGTAARATIIKGFPLHGANSST